MDADSGSSGVKDDAGGGVGVVGNAGAGGHGDEFVSTAGEHRGDAVSGEQGAQVQGESEGDGFFVKGGRELRAEVGTAVGCVDDDGEVGGLRLRRAAGNIYTLCRGSDGKNEAGAEGDEAGDGADLCARPTG